MKESHFKLSITGEEAEETAQRLSHFFESEFYQSPEREMTAGLPERPATRSIDPLTAVAVVLTIPSAILATVDLIARKRSRQKIEELILLAKDLPGEVNIITPEGTVIQLKNADSSDILDTANQAAALPTDE